MQDNFYLENGLIPLTHTSSVQIRYMEEHPPSAGPIRIVSPGTVYRNEDEDSTHIWVFHQLEGLVVDEGISLGDLKGTLEFMMKTLLGEAAQVKLSPSFFPYTEPSLEVYARVDKDSPWIEMAGAGMVHPDVLQKAGIEPAKYSGFAFGAGLERLAAIKYGITDVRYFWRPDLRFIGQF
jgi:phenylalanyl-tRNA synthetase alpha chain